MHNSATVVKTSACILAWIMLCENHLKTCTKVIENKVTSDICWNMVIKFFFLNSNSIKYYMLNWCVSPRGKVVYCIFIGVLFARPDCWDVQLVGKYEWTQAAVTVLHDTSRLTQTLCCPTATESWPRRYWDKECPEENVQVKTPALQTSYNARRLIQEYLR